MKKHTAYLVHLNDEPSHVVKMENVILFLELDEFGADAAIQWLEDARALVRNPNGSEGQIFVIGAVYERKRWPIQSGLILSHVAARGFILWAMEDNGYKPSMTHAEKLAILQNYVDQLLR